MIKTFHEFVYSADLIIWNNGKSLSKLVESPFLGDKYLGTENFVEPTVKSKFIGIRDGCSTGKEMYPVIVSGWDFFLCK